jgi:ankyrin repeat protein
MHREDIMEMLSKLHHRGHKEIVKLLLERGADVNAQGGYYGNALQAASYGGHKELFSCCLKEEQM